MFGNNGVDNVIVVGNYVNNMGMNWGKFKSRLQRSGGKHNVKNLLFGRFLGEIAIFPF